MANGKHPTFRYRIINLCFTNKQKRYWTIPEIMEELKEHDLSATYRTVERDFETMRFDKRLGYKAPIVYNRREKGYHYADPDYSIEKLPLGEEEIEMFEFMVDSFQRFKGAQILNQVEGMFDKLGKVVGQLKQKKRSKLSYSPILFESVPYYKGIENFDALYHAIIKQKPLLIRYKKFDHEIPKEHIFHPYLLKEFKHRWYLLGYSEKRRGKIILALDRMESITEKNIPFKPYKGADVQKYFDHTLGITINNTGVKEIRLWFSASQGNYIKTQHLHTSQRIVSDTPEGLVITLQLIPNYELLQTLLAFGAEVKVLEPQSLKDEVTAMLQKNLDLYKS